MSTFKDNISTTIVVLNIGLDDIVAELKNTLSAANVSGSEVIVDELQTSNTHLQALLAAHENDENDLGLKYALKRFLKARWDYIRNTTGAYVELPFGPMNQICQELAMELAEPCESIAKILMPTLCIEDYSTIDQTLITLTETDPEKGDRRLAFHKFIISHDGKAVIPLKH